MAKKKPEDFPEFMQALEKVAKAVGKRCSFNDYEPDDIKQEARIEGLAAFEGWDQSRPPGPYLFHHVLNRLRNLYRNKVHRNDPPCKGCYSGHPPHDDNKFCAKFLAWKKLNGSKSALSALSGLEESVSETEDKLGRPPLPGPELNELCDKIDEMLPVGLRKEFLILINGGSIPPGRKRVLQESVRSILKRLNHGEEEG